MLSSLPPSPSLEHLKNQARTLLKAVRAHDSAAIARAREQLPAFSDPAEFSLANAQFVLAREHGFPSWPRLRAYIDSITGARASRRRPLSAEIEYFNERASGLVRSHCDAIPAAIAQLREFHPRFARMSEDEIRRSSFTLQDARLAIAREHGFDTWRRFYRYLGDLAAGKTSEPFLAAFEALRNEDFDRFQHLLEQDASLANAPGTNGNTLLNLAVSCRKPAAVRMLLSAGADVNRANKYGWTPLHQAAYSNQSELVRQFIDHGGDLRLSARGDGGTPLVQALFWGHRELAEEIVSHGIVPCNLRVAAGLGRLDLMEAFFDGDGRLTPDAGLNREFYRPHPGFPTWSPTNDSQEILDEALLYAAKNDRLEALPFLVARGANINAAVGGMSALEWAASRQYMPVLEWLLDHGADPNLESHGDQSTWQSPLHCAASAGRLESVRLLMERGADTTLRDSAFHSTPLGWANHFNQPETRDYLLQHGTLDLADAISFNRPDRVKELLDADPAAVNRPLYNTGPTEMPELPLRRAERDNLPDMVKLLRDRGAVEPSPQNGKSNARANGGRP